MSKPGEAPKPHSYSATFTEPEIRLLAQLVAGISLGRDVRGLSRGKHWASVCRAVQRMDEQRKKHEVERLRAEATSGDANAAS